MISTPNLPPFSVKNGRIRYSNYSSDHLATARQKVATKAHSDGKQKRYIDFLNETKPKNWTIDAAHIRLISQYLDKVESGEIKRLAIHMPPRHGKSETVTYRFPVRWLERNPSHNVLVTGYNERFARKFGRRCRNLAKERGIVSDDKAASDEWETLSGGLLMTRGVGSPPTGTGFNLIVIDDPVKRREDAESDTIREKTWDWYTDDLYQRLEPNGAIVLIMTLWHEDDIGARIVESEEGWTVLKLPALAQENDPLGRTEGQALWPDRYSESALHRIRAVMARNDGERSFEALFQQNPTPKEGDFFKVSKLEIVTSIPANTRKCRGWDIAHSAGSGARSAGVKVETVDDVFYVTDVTKGQWATDERDKVIKQCAMMDSPDTLHRLPEDPGAGKSLAVAFVKLLAGHKVRTVRVIGDKEVRADAFSSQVNAGNVKLLKGDWNKEFIEELRQFPNGKFKDQVDAASDAFSEVALTHEPTPVHSRTSKRIYS